MRVYGMSRKKERRGDAGVWAVRTSAWEACVCMWKWSLRIVFFSFLLSLEGRESEWKSGFRSGRMAVGKCGVAGNREGILTCGFG